jgi:chlorite dismutase
MEPMSDPSAEPVSESEALGYTLWAVFRRDPAHPAPDGDLGPAVTAVEGADVTVRGFYDVSGLRADADLMIWLHGAEPEALQAALRELRRAEPLASLLPVWNAMRSSRLPTCRRSCAARPPKRG